ncbi:MAG: hypothetical protein DI537_60690, partial [Stutzerimonas stutzeri]
IASMRMRNSLDEAEREHRRRANTPGRGKAARSGRQPRADNDDSQGMRAFTFLRGHPAPIRIDMK